MNYNPYPNLQLKGPHLSIEVLLDLVSDGRIAPRGYHHGQRRLREAGVEAPVVGPQFSVPHDGAHHCRGYYGYYVGHA